MKKRRTLVNAVRRAYSDDDLALQGAINDLEGCPAGGWPQTRQALRRISEELPRREERSYEREDFIESCFDLDVAERYRRRPKEEALVAARAIKPR
jgi:hypothetical protein